MGSRANVIVRDGEKTGVFIYTHWDGYKLPIKVQKALAKKWRWDDEMYLTRIIYDEVVKGNELTETGFGIGTHVGDNGHKIIIVDTRQQTVRLVTLQENIFQAKASHSWTFEEYILLSHDDINTAYNG